MLTGMLPNYLVNGVLYSVVEHRMCSRVEPDSESWTVREPSVAKIGERERRERFQLSTCSRAARSPPTDAQPPHHPPALFSTFQKVPADLR
jgi:hypothetical protein